MRRGWRWPAETAPRAEAPPPRLRHRAGFRRLEGLGEVPPRQSRPRPGQAGLTPEERFANHAAGVRSSHLVHRFALHLRPDLSEGINPMSYREAARMEKVLAKVLRSDGYGVWQN